MSGDVATKYANTRARPRLGTLLLVAALHLAVFYGLVRAFAPDFTAEVQDSVVAAFSVEAPKEKPPEPKPEPTKPAPDEGASGDIGKKATPKEVVAPEPKQKIPREEKAPKTASTGAANSSGAADKGAGTGGGGEGDGTGSGNGGEGPGSGCPPRPSTKPSVLSGEINTARDFPVPGGGRKARFGRSVTVLFTVTTEGRARGCSVQNSSVDAEATALVCPLVMQRIRFQPAKMCDGTPVEARYGYRVSFAGR